jgi:hypothetical protein
VGSLDPKETMKLVQEGLEDLRKGRLVKAKEDYSKYLQVANEWGITQF